ncbi:MAG TPA: hypothetical protein EYF98_02405 [Planctomycetes bacterium]|nr:hypothetical protein [Planctomycetota bacterium]
MEKLRAQRAAEADADAAPRKVPSRKPAKTKGKAPAETSSEEAKTTRGKRKSGSSTGPKTRAAARRAKGKSSRSSASDSRRSGTDEDKDQGTGGGTSGRWQPKKKKSPLPFVGSLVGAVIVAVLIWKFVLNETPVEETPIDTTVAEAGAAEANEPIVEVPTVQEPEEVVDTPAEEPAEEVTEPAKPVNRYDPTSVDLSALEAFDAQEGTTPAEWTDIQQLTALAIDPDAGAAGARAVKKLVEDYGPKAFGSIVNRMTTIDYGTEQGFRDGDVLQRALMDISNGKNAGWAYSISDKDHVFNKKVVRLLHKVWARARTDEAYWLNYSKQDGAAEEKAEAADLGDDDLDALDELDF